MYHTMQRLIQTALEEDIGSGDITTDNLIEPDMLGDGIIVAKEPLVIAGLDAAKQVFKRLDENIVCQSEYKDGDFVNNGAIILKIKGRLNALLIGERSALNFLGHLSGIATYTRSCLDKLNDKKIRLVDTRKTTPGWRVLEKYAVRIGGAHNHRIGLFDGVLIKDNHIAACGGIAKAITRIKNNVSHFMKIEVEVSDLECVKEALHAGADIIMLDNMNLKQIEKAVQFIDGKALVEASGGVTKDKLEQLARTGIDIISCGALTHSAKCVDISMRITS